MALSIGRMGAASTVSYTSIKPQNYSLSNNSEVSSAYEASRANETSGIGAVDPVQYPNATAQSKSSAMVASSKMESAFNDIASSYEGMTTAYDPEGNGLQYDILGSNVDVFG